MMKKIPYHEQLLSDMRNIEERIDEIKGMVLRWQSLMASTREQDHRQKQKDGRKKR